MPVRPDTHSVDTPRAERVEVAVTRRHRPERVEQADAGQERALPVDENVLLRDAERGGSRRRNERRRQTREAGGYCEGAMICPGTRNRSWFSGTVALPRK